MHNTTMHTMQRRMSVSILTMLFVFLGNYSVHLLACTFAEIRGVVFGIVGGDMTEPSHLCLQALFLRPIPRE